MLLKVLAGRRPRGLGQGHGAPKLLDLVQEPLWVVGDLPAHVPTDEDGGALGVSQAFQLLHDPSAALAVGILELGPELLFASVPGTLRL